MSKRVLLVMAVVLLVFFTYSVSGAAAPQVTKLKFANFFPPTHKHSILFEKFCEDIKKKTGGRVEISYYPGGTLLTAPKMAAGVASGIADIGLSHCGYTRGRFPIMEIMELPLGYPSGYIGTYAATDFYEKFKPKEWDGFQPLMFVAGAPCIIMTVSKPIRTLEDLKGVKIRGTGRIGDLIKSLGGIPVPLEMGDLYEGLRRGTIEGTFTAAETLKGWKLGELVRNATTCWQVGASYTFYVAMNKDKWNALPADIKKIFDETSVEYRYKFAVQWNEVDIEGMDLLKASGGQTIPLSDAEAAKWINAAQPVITDFKKDLLPKGYTEKEVDSWIAFVKERIEYWKGQEKAKNLPKAYQY
jgi:TRAP-type C4-dicarboxylate transport system substrate-binding protein